MPHCQIHLLVAAGTTLLGGAANANPAIAWYSIDGGGTVSTNGGTILRAVIAQADAGGVQAGGVYVLRGGFLNPRVPRNSPCGPADLAIPFGELNIDDVLSFLNAFVVSDPAADFAPPLGTFDIDDVLTFLDAFVAGCP
ncbi:MAG: GC-type dockerin domain-anchored protein [Phycisphaerales bacterium]